jgi:hypothetical protein
VSDQAAPAVLLLTFGSPEGDHDLGPFLVGVLAREPAPHEVTDLRRRYDQVGWSPLMRITGELAAALEARLRLTHPGRAGARRHPACAPHHRRRHRRARADWSAVYLRHPAGTPARPQGCVKVE